MDHFITKAFMDRVADFHAIRRASRCEGAG